MASKPFQRDGKGPWRTKWRTGRGAPWQECKFDDMELTIQAQKIAELHRHRITDADVYKILLNIPDQPTPAPMGLTFDQWAERWFKNKGDVDADTLAGYKSTWRNHLSPFFGWMALSIVEEETIEDWVTDMRAKPAMRNGKPSGRPISATTTGHAHALLHQMLGDAVPKHMPRNPAAKPRGKRTTRLPKPEVPFEPIYLEKWEAELLVRVCPIAIRDLVLTALGTGMRLGELIPLQVGDVNLDGLVPTITIRRGLKRKGRVGAPKSQKSRRTITISWGLAAILRPRCKGKAKTALVYPSPLGCMWTEANLNGRYWQKAVAAASFCTLHRPAPKISKRGTELHDPFARSTCDCPGRLQSEPRLHDLRHTHVGWLLDLGWDFHKIQLRLGHEKVETTINRYGPRKRDVKPEDLEPIDLIRVEDPEDYEDLVGVKDLDEYKDLGDGEAAEVEDRESLGGVIISKVKINLDPKEVGDLAKLDMLGRK